ncbi:hypothetical protein LTR50_000380 [Elasticomyces elasticus]|nr:hypothetical protein LTR50_000380 [Elasticomyces elasticus]
MRLVATTLSALVCAGSLSAAQNLPFDPREATIASTHHALYTGLATCREITSSFLSRIVALNNHTNAIISLNPSALAVADSYDNLLLSNNATTGPLFCIPILLKDNYNTKEIPTTGGNLDLAQSQPTEDAPAVTALKNAGAIILGKSNLHELALEGISVSSLGGQTINPYDFSRTPGGSSGGSGAAVAASFSVFATGTDTVNSLRSPASANSLFSCRPTRGLISRAGIMPISYTQDAIGPIGRCVEDVAVALTVMSSVGFDERDNTTALVPAGLVGSDYSVGLTTGSLKGLRLGLLEGFFNRTATNETTPVNNAMATMVSHLRSAGAIIIPINESLYNATAILARYDTQRYEYRQEMDAYLNMSTLGGTHPSTLASLYASGKFVVIPSQYEYVTTSLVSSTSNATYAAVRAGGANLTLALQHTFTANKLDAIIYPEQKNLVVKLGAPSQAGRNGILAALTGFPVVTVPAGFSPKTAEAPLGVPIGMEILGRPWTEGALLRMAWQIEQLTKVRKTPAWARQVVPTRNYTAVPSVVPDRGNVPRAYPLGVL